MGVSSAIPLIGILLGQAVMIGKDSEEVKTAIESGSNDTGRRKNRVDGMKTSSVGKPPDKTNYHILIHVSKSLVVARQYE